MPPEKKGLKLNTVECQICEKQLSDRRNLNRHMRNIHRIEPKVREPKLNCCYNDDCPFITSTQRLLREHLAREHNFIVERKEFSFDTRSDFEVWKHEEEVSSFASYVTDTGVKYRSDKKISYYRCHRSGHIRSDKKGRVTDRKRSKPSRGYTQDGIICPSSLQVTENQNGKFKVVYFSTHLGHSQDAESVKYLKLSTKEKEEIAAKLVHGEPIEKIIADARKRKGKKISRLNLLLKRDVYNIKCKVNYLEKETDHDGLIIDSWVKKMDSGDPMKNPVIFYNPLDDSHNYFLVLIHSIQKIIFSLVHDGSMVYVKTKRGKLNVDFNLISLNILTENGEGYPIAFCISNKTDYLTIHNFFKLVCNALGCIKAEIFISDNISHYYTAWKGVMGECDKKLLCTFNVELLWEQKLGQWKCPVEKQELVMNQLKKLLNELDSDVFENELIETLNTWDDDKDLKSFVRFFYKFYGKKPCEWANCYRVHSVTEESINNFLEPFHTVLESIYQKGINDVYNSLNLLFDFVRDECLFHIMKWDPDIKKDKSKEVETCHGGYGKIVNRIECKGTEWVVTDSFSDYVVCKITNGCGKDCGLICQQCGICVHDYSCTCNDYVIGFNICVHIHAVADSSISTDDENVIDVSSKRMAISAAKNLVEQLKQSDLSEEIYQRISSAINKIFGEYFDVKNSDNNGIGINILRTLLSQEAD